MRAVVQRVSQASVTVDGHVVGSIQGPGLCVLVGVAHDDTTGQAAKLADKIHNLRIFDGDRSAADLDAPLLVVSQFTLYADVSRGRRPSWSAAAPGQLAEPRIAELVAELRARGATVATGSFGATMSVALVNEGPVTLIIDT